MFCKKVVPKTFAKFTVKHLCQILLFNKVAGLRPPIFIKKETLAQVYSVNFTKFLRTPFLKEHLWWLLLPFFIRFLMPWFFIHIVESAYRSERIKIQRFYFILSLHLLRYTFINIVYALGFDGLNT